MDVKLLPLQAPSLKDVFVERFEGLILSGQVDVGQRLPSERDLATQLGVSRPVVHAGLAELEARGLVTVRPRARAVVNDYRRSGSLALLTSLINYQRGEIDPSLLVGMLDMRKLVETETARCAARQRTAEDLGRLGDLLAAERAADPTDTAAVTDLDFELHHAVALASGNPVYPLLIKSFEPAYKNFSGQFFAVPAVVAVVVEYHERLLECIDARDESGAAGVMDQLLQHGQVVLADVMSRNNP